MLLEGSRLEVNLHLLAAGEKGINFFSFFADLIAFASEGLESTSNVSSHDSTSALLVRITGSDPLSFIS